MLLNDYLNKLKKTSLKELNKPWVKSDLLNKRVLSIIFFLTRKQKNGKTLT